MSNTLTDERLGELIGLAREAARDNPTCEEWYDTAVACRELQEARKENARIWTEVVADLEAENKRLREALALCDEHARHDSGCMKPRAAGHDCVCGYDDHTPKWKALLGEDEK